MEQVIFGGSGLDRAAELRDDIPALAAAMQEPASRGSLPGWDVPQLNAEAPAGLHLPGGGAWTRG